jgi:hypothetical protein
MAVWGEKNMTTRIEFYLFTVGGILVMAGCTPFYLL